MKKLTLFAAVAVSLFVVSVADAQSDTTTATTTRTKHTAKRTTTITTRDNAAVTRRLRRIEANSRSITTTVPQGTRIDGSVARTVRSQNALQMINPFAPKEYGDGTDVTFHEPDDAFQRPEGLRLFAVEF